ncbi:hypothetical protein H310_12326 [Aphanomyces invadans]|uniref:Uncharacterized protein n=1 Tax=Aphanomyces invadans TaxID=157072 RepID=A0A024THW9_9STRA|nr:hypothetical protein H310_12326 [Aphanomyces invadans]ETV93760.1 hypothetical protein H310_12326 [Aphanomyces invadans]|eukprot:XP_008877569.1 hypothetical protein H310_12326 [Aphanomyces invadans]
MTFLATRPQSARPSTAHHRTKTNKITLGTYRFRPGTSSLERVGPVDVHTPVLTLLGLMADDMSPLYHSVHHLKMHRFRAHLPSTVIIGRHSEPCAWYYTNKEGYVLKKHAAHCTWKNVRDAFCGRYTPRHMEHGQDKNVHWPVAVAKFDDGRMRVLTLHALYTLLRSLDAEFPAKTADIHPFCIQAFVPPAKRVRYISIYTLVRNIGDCHVVVAELASNYKEQSHDSGHDVDVTKEPIEILEAEHSMMVESIKRTTLLLIHHVNRKNSASNTPVISKLIAEYMIHTKDNEVYLTAILGVSWQNGDQVQMADFQTEKIRDLTAIDDVTNQARNNATGATVAKGLHQNAVVKQVKQFARSLQGSTELYEAAERHASECQAAAETLQAQVVELQAELEHVKAKLDTSTAHADAQRKIKCLEGRIELQEKEIAKLDATLAAYETNTAKATADLDRERVLFCEALKAAQVKIVTLTDTIAQLEQDKAQLNTQVSAHAQAMRAAAGTIEALQGAVDKQKLSTHQVSSSLRDLQIQLNAMEAENDKLKALVPFASVKKISWCSKMHLHDFAMEWPDYRMEIGVLNRALGAHYSVLKRIFTQYLTLKVPLIGPTIPLGRTHPLLSNQLNYAQLLACMETCHIITTRFTPPQLEVLYTKCTAARWHQTHGPKLTTAGVSMPRGIVLIEFMELLVRVAHIRGGGKSGLVGEKFHTLVEDCIYPQVRWKDIEAVALK